MFCSITVYCVSTVLPLENSKEKIPDLLFTEMCLNVNIIVHVDIQFPTKTLLYVCKSRIACFACKYLKHKSMQFV